VVSQQLEAHRKQIESQFNAAWEAVNIYDGVEQLHTDLASLSQPVCHLLCAAWCVAEVYNGGFHQFFWNSTGVLAPEAVSAFRAIDLGRHAETLVIAMSFLGDSYLRDREPRQQALDAMSEMQCDALRKMEDEWYGPLKDQYRQSRQKFIDSLMSG
jgi:hypothetical protein